MGTVNHADFSHQRRQAVIVFGWLLVLLAASIAVAYLHLGSATAFVAMAIALVKAALVALYFMHVRHSPPLVWLFAAIGALWLLIAFLLTFSDYLTRYF